MSENIGIAREAIEERDMMEQQYNDLANELIYEGNSVSWWHSKAKNYGNALTEAWKALYECGVVADGETTVAEGIREYKKAADKEIATKDAELARLREALHEIIEQGRTGEDAYVMADLALEALKSQ